MRFWRNTSLATLPEGQTAALPSGTLGLKWAADVDNGFRPAGLLSLSTATLYPERWFAFRLWSNLMAAGTATHHVSLYRAQWSNGIQLRNRTLVLGSGCAARRGRLRAGWTNPTGHHQPARRHGRSTGNHPGASDIATKSADTTPPTSVISSAPTYNTASKRRLPGRLPMQAVELWERLKSQLDGGRTLASGRRARELDVRLDAFMVRGFTTLMVRASDDSANVQSPPTIATFEISGGSTMWSDLADPDTSLSDDTNPVELGMKFRSDVSRLCIPGCVSTKGPKIPEPISGNLWTNDGTRLASVTFMNESPSGWQQAFFASPVELLANTTYVISYYAPTAVMRRVRISLPPAWIRHLCTYWPMETTARTAYLSTQRAVDSRTKPLRRATIG